jgi:hypothetical protein
MIFQAWPKIARLNRPIVVTEKIDGTNAAVVIEQCQPGEESFVGSGLRIGAQSRTKIITPGDDNYSFASWVQKNKEDLVKLGPGRHFGEWWGAGIQKRYGKLKSEKTFSLFNTSRWSNPEDRPKCCDVVPVLYVGPFSQAKINECLEKMKAVSVACPGAKAEGIVVFFAAANTMFKVTCEADDQWKGSRGS